MKLLMRLLIKRDLMLYWRLGGLELELDHILDDRNNWEKLTLAVLSHLPTAVLYVHDLTGECGTSPSNQYIIYKEVRERFSNHLWVNVVSKSDMFQKSPVRKITEDGDDETLEMARYRKAGPDGAIFVSVKTEAGLDELKSNVHDMLISQLDKLKSERLKASVQKARSTC